MFEFIETPFFTKAIARYLDDEEYAKLQNHLNEHPESGAIVAGSGGVRKMRWAAEGRGKRGGLRVIYYLLRRRGKIWMLTVYGKNVRDTIPAHLLRQMKEAIDDAKDD
ncbi:MAG TPA: type II toxin-antitoxin system RelE/ParE family toxin [Verrucomicrobiae bacterium]|nr:type II toxin-antitoxin system RelE/ParE family toxin [Verrucomicrobiae bacterium]